MNHSADAVLHDPAARLSQRQIECLELAGQGYTSKEIGRSIGLSPSTVDNHISAAVDRLGARNRVEAVRFLLGRSPSSEHRPSGIGEDPLPHASETATFNWRRLPPLGGRPNLLSKQQRLLGIFQIAIVCVAVTTAIILTIAGLVHVLD